MKKLLCILLLLFCIIGINSQTILTLGRVKVDGLNIARSGENLLVSMNIDVAGIDMPSSREVSFAPVLRAENNELFLSPVVLTFPFLVSVSFSLSLTISFFSLSFYSFNHNIYQKENWNHCEDHFSNRWTFLFDFLFFFLFIHNPLSSNH